MKATLRYDFNDYSDVLAHKRAIKSTDAYIAMHSFMEELLRLRKYEELTEENYDFLETIIEKYSNILNDLGIDLNDLE